MMFHRTLAVGAVLVLTVAACASDEATPLSGEPSGTEPAPTENTLQTPATVAPATTITPTTIPAATITPTSIAATTIPAATMADGVIILADDSRGRPISATVDPVGRLMVAYWSVDDEALKVVRCVDADCAEPPETFTLGSIPAVTIEGDEQGVGFVDMVLQPDGAPIVIAQDPRLETLIYVCSDADCTTVDSADFTVSGSVEWPHLVMASDGLPRISYGTSNVSDGLALEFAVCGDLVCSADLRTTVTIDGNGWGGGEHSMRIDPEGRILIGFENMSPELGEARVAVCADDTCSTGLTMLTFDNAVGPRITDGTDGNFWVWYRTGPPGIDGDMDASIALAAWDLMVASCDITGCAEATSVEVGWGMLLAWPWNVRLVSVPDGPLVAAFSYWSSELCAQPLELTILDPYTAQVGAQLGAYHLWYPAFDAVGTDRGVMAVFTSEAEGGLQAVELGIGDTAAAGLDASCSLPQDESFEGFAKQGDVLNVMGRAYDDLLSVGAIPGSGGLAEVRPILPTGRISANLVATGRARELAAAIWYEVTVFDTTGWVDSSFVGFVAATDDTTAEFLAQNPLSEAETMVDLGLLVAESYASDDPPSLVVQAWGPWPDVPAEVIYDVIGIGDDSVAGYRFHVFARPAESGEGFVLRTIERTTFCSRGVDGEQCI